MEGRVYRPLPIYSEEEARRILKEGELEELLILPFSVGQHFVNWKKAQDICVDLMQHKDEGVRANAAMGLAYIARTKNKLEKEIVKPLLLRELKNNMTYQWRIMDAIEDINLFLNWKIGIKEIERIKNALEI